VFVRSYAAHRADAVKNGEAPVVAIWLNGQDQPFPSRSKGWTYLGAVSSYIFVYDHDAARAEILQVNNVARIEPMPGASEPTNSSVVIAPIP
jgi:hypothetical protein